MLQQTMHSQLLTKRTGTSLVKSAASHAQPAAPTAFSRISGAPRAAPRGISIQASAQSGDSGLRKRAPAPAGSGIRERQTVLEFDPAQYLGYGAAITTQVGLMTGALWALQQLADALSSGALSVPGGVAGEDAAKGAVTLFWLVVSIKSRIFSPLNASRPSLKGEKTAMSERRRPSWMPPPLTFPIVWTTIGLLRCASSVMVWEACGRDLISAPLIVMCLHLAIGDAWNNVNVVRQELGMAVPGVILGCLGSGIFVTASYYMADPTAGLVLSPMVLWLSIASALVYSIWDLNTDEQGNRMPILPVKQVTL